MVHDARWPWGRVEVVGDSMEPTLHAGDWWLVRWLPPVKTVAEGQRVRTFIASRPRVAVGDVVVARRPDRPELLVVKRVARREPTGWWLAGDNPHRSDDSRVFGAVPDDVVIGRLVRRYRRGR